MQYMHYYTAMDGNFCSLSKRHQATQLQRKKTHLRSGLGQLDAQATACRCLSNSTFSSDKDPLKTALVDDVFQGGLREIGIVDINVRHITGITKIVVEEKEILVGFKDG
jgi:hypothetical protein